MVYKKFIEFVQALYPERKPVFLHEPCFIGNEKKYVQDAIDSTFVSSIGKYVDRFEEELAKALRAKYAVAVVNGTSALHVSLILSGVQQNHEVITQPLTFVATCNAISYCNASPVFVDVDMDTLGMSPDSLEAFLSENTYIENNKCYNKRTKRIISACVPMHTFGHPCKIGRIKQVCDKYHITVIEDAAEAVGSVYEGKPVGTFGKLGVISFNGNKIITSGGGGAIVTNDKDLARKAKHLTTTAKISHPWKYEHDQVGYNYRMPNINAALLCAQLEQLDFFIENKRETARLYKNFFSREKSMKFVEEPKGCKSIYWLNAIQLADMETRDEFLKTTNESGVMTRPIWTLMNRLKMYKDVESYHLVNAKKLEQTIVNLPSSVRI